MNLGAQRTSSMHACAHIAERTSFARAHNAPDAHFSASRAEHREGDSFWVAAASDTVDEQNFTHHDTREPRRRHQQGHAPNPRAHRFGCGARSTSLSRPHRPCRDTTECLRFAVQPDHAVSGLPQFWVSATGSLSKGPLHSPLASGKCPVATHVLRRRWRVCVRV